MEQSQELHEDFVKVSGNVGIRENIIKFRTDGILQQIELQQFSQESQ